MTVDGMLRRMSSRELSEWIAFYNIEPFGEERQDLRNAMACCVMANAWRGKGKAFKINDFMLRFEQKKQSAETMKKLLEIAVRKAGGKVIRNGKVVFDGNNQHLNS